MTVKEKASCILTIEMLKRLALNIHGLIDVVDDNNIKKVIKLIQDYPEWVDITEKLPPEGKEILVCDIDGDIYLTHRIAESEHSSRYYDSDGNKIKSITAWQPLPKPYDVIN